MQSHARSSSFQCLLCALAAACGSDPEPAENGEDPAEHACEHAAEQGTAVTVAPDRATAPAISISEEPYSVALAGSAAGFLRVEGPLEALLFVDTAGVVNALYHGDSPSSELPEPAPNQTCPDSIPEHFDLDLHETGSFYLSLGPAAVPGVWLMLTEAGRHAH